ncbi:MAG: hypothetical protein R3E75_03565 [Steroidobacteraceae bacterium]|nr:hypothetical protein [Nevskiaceae bacterium]
MHDFIYWSCHERGLYFAGNGLISRDAIGRHLFTEFRGCVVNCDINPAASQGVEMNGAWHRFRSAALLLARSGTVKERLQSAYRLHLADLDSTQLPAEIRGNFEALRGALTREKPMRGEDAVTASIRKLSSREVDDLAAGLIEMFASFSQLEDLEPLHPAAATASSTVKAQIVPLFALEARS